MEYDCPAPWKGFLLILLCFLGIYPLRAQDPLEGDGLNNEIKLNVLYLLLGYPEISYERILTGESAVGLSAAFSIDDTVEVDFAAIPYYRLYFGKKRAAGFFVEGFGVIFSQEAYDDFSYEPGGSSNSLGAGLGVSVGGKFLTRSGWIAELVAGIGRNLVNTESIDVVYPRFGISMGKRF